MKNLERFKKAYRINLLKAHAIYPSDYNWPMEEFEAVYSRMCKSIQEGNFNKDSHGIKWTCKELGIKHTYKAIFNFINKSATIVSLLDELEFSLKERM